MRGATRALRIGLALAAIGLALDPRIMLGGALEDTQARRVRPGHRPQPPESEKPSVPLPQEPTSPEIISLHSDLVLVTVGVLGPRGEWVTGLGPDDFEILEDGVPQQIAFFSGEAALPLRLVVLVDTSLSVKNRLEFEKQAVARFFRSVMRPRDLAALISVSTEPVLRQNFTEDVAQLVSAVRGLKAEGATALYDALVVAAEHLATIEGRRAIVILSDGRDTVSRATLGQALRRVQEVGATVYAINVDEPLSANVRDLIGETSLELLARQTGGEVFSPTQVEELDPIFARLVEQLRTQYVLGFYSTNEARDGAFRRLTVRVKRDGVIARARAGYYAPRR
ncbi:MAG: VWA domain-containing protein [Blastocatellia bacterium]|nr:VWA domain-containing protein [Blastocatellia bacterium]MDW8256731.1 VWA domain-containing protein [Acidobacteriota bacterium]